MPTIQQIMNRARSLRNETAINSISPERAGGIMYDTLAYINEMQLQGANPLLLSKIYESVAEMEADPAPVSDLDGSALLPGQLVCIVTGDPDDPEDGLVYRYDGTEDDTSSWTAVGRIGSAPYLEGFLYMGKAVLSPTPTDPGAPTQKVFYQATEPGIYTNFGGHVVAAGEVAVFKWDGSWSKESTGIATSAQVSSLSNNLKSRLYVTPECSGDDVPGELSIADENGNVICKFKDGQIKTKNFDSSGPGQLSTADAEYFYITDGNGNVVLEVVGGHIKTKNFDSTDVSKKFGTLSVMGDSWSALKNYVYPADNAYYYPSSDPGAQGYGSGNDVENVEQMWWYLLATQMKTRVMRIAARSGSRIANSGSTTTSFLGREGDIGDFPELILVLGTRNDDSNTDLGEYKYSDWTDTDLEDYRPAVAKLLSDLLHNNIGSQILFVSNSANADKISSAQTICEHYGVPFLLVTLNNEQVTGSHPNSAGMSFICSEIFNKLNTL